MSGFSFEGPGLGKPPSSADIARQMLKTQGGRRSAWPELVQGLEHLAQSQGGCGRFGPVKQRIYGTPPSCTPEGLRVLLSLDCRSEQNLAEFGKHHGTKALHELLKFIGGCPSTAGALSSSTAEEDNHEKDTAADHMTRLEYLLQVHEQALPDDSVPCFSPGGSEVEWGESMPALNDTPP